MRAAVSQLLTPVQELIRTESASGVVLIAAAVVAFAWANSPWSASYFAILEIPLGIGAGGWGLGKPLLLWVNDLLMAIFFFLIGLEIKREVMVGELAGWRRAALPIAGALGGMVVPALIYVAFNFGAPTLRGWGVPMATDIAFALGVLALLGDRVSLPLKVFLLALAIVDDLGAVLVIALFYTETVHLGSLALAFVVWAAALAYGRFGGARALGFAVIGAVMWYFMLKSGVHATIAGVLMALAVPLRHQLTPQELQQELRRLAGPGRQLRAGRGGARASRRRAGAGAQPAARHRALAGALGRLSDHAGVRLLQRRRRARRRGRRAARSGRRSARRSACCSASPWASRASPGSRCGAG